MGTGQGQRESGIGPRPGASVLGRDPGVCRVVRALSPRGHGESRRPRRHLHPWVRLGEFSSPCPHRTSPQQGLPRASRALLRGHFISNADAISHPALLFHWRHVTTRYAVATARDAARALTCSPRRRVPCHGPAVRAAESHTLMTEAPTSAPCVLVWATRSRMPHACASVNTAACAQHVRVHRGCGVSGTLRAGCAPQGGQACEGLRAHDPSHTAPRGTTTATHRSLARAAADPPLRGRGGFTSWKLRFAHLSKIQILINRHVPKGTRAPV